MEQLKMILLQLEQAFFQLEYISNRDWLEQHLHDNFEEIGKSGNWSREEVINALLMCEQDRDITMDHAQVKVVSDDVCLVLYETQEGQQCVQRTSLWLKDGEWKLYHHQASMRHPL